MSKLSDDLRACADYVRQYGWNCGTVVNSRGGGCVLYTIRRIVGSSGNNQPLVDEVKLAMGIKGWIFEWSDELPPATAAETVIAAFTVAAEAVEQRERPERTPDWNAIAAKRPEGVIASPEYVS